MKNVRNEGVTDDALSTLNLSLGASLSTSGDICTTTGTPTPTNPPFLMMHLPDEPVLLQAVARVALRHAQLDYMLKMAVKTLAGVTIEQALDATEYVGARELRERVKKLAKNAFGEGPALIKFQALLTRCARATDRRNDLLHNIWCRFLDGDAHVKTSTGLEPLPKAEELEALAREIKGLCVELNEARLEGYIHQALKYRANP